MKKNGYFLAAGILSILSSVVYAIAIFAFGGVINLIKEGNYQFIDEYGNPLTAEEIELLKSTLSTVYTVLSIGFAICIIFAIFQAVVYLKYSSKSYDEMRKSSGLVITAIVLSFLSCGILIGILGIMGYMLKPQQTQETIVDMPSSDTQNFDKIKTQLMELDELKKSGVISEEEYAEKRKDIINNM